ncbi:hypothetical protein Tco_1338968 [Tanacetum coccineum]
MAQLPIKAQRHPWLRYENGGYTDEIIQNFEQRLARIFSRRIHRVQVLDFRRLTEEMGMNMDVRLSMEHSDAQGQVVFTSHAWRRLFADTILELEDDGTFSFQLGGARRQMSWRQSILALGLHTTEEIDIIRDLLRRLYHRLIAHTIAGRGHAPEKVTRTDLYFLRSMDQEAVNLLYFLAHYLFRHAEGRKRHLAWVALGPERQQVAAAGALEDVKGAHAEVEGDQAVPALVQAPQPPPTVA